MTEFSESSFRAKRSNFDPTKEWTHESEPGTHIALAVFGYLIYELNKCGKAMTKANVIECNKQIAVCQSFASKKDDFSSILTSLPTKAVKDEMLKINKVNSDNLENRQKGDGWRNTVASMKTIDDLRNIVVTLVTGAKADEAAARMSAQCHMIISELKTYDWAKFESGKYHNSKMLC